MSPPPTTPTPRRFLLPRRAPQSGRFHSTPRFSAPSSSSRPTQARDLIEDVDDDDDEEKVEMSSVEGDEDDGNKGDDLSGDAIDGASIESPSSSSQLEVDSGTPRDAQPELGGVKNLVASPEDTPIQRDAKRRKLSISPVPEFGSPSRHTEPSQETEEGFDDEHSDDVYSGGSSDMGYDDYTSDTDARLRSKPKQQPTFRSAPRFKQNEDHSMAEGLPAAFSPQHRGARYLTGGLAAELQGWLAQVKRDDELVGSTFQFHVQEIQPGRRMYLIRGNFSQNQELRRVILAGEGRLTGLDRRAVVVVGSVVEIGQPIWDVEVDGATWTVACDWAVV